MENENSRSFEQKHSVEKDVKDFDGWNEIKKKTDEKEINDDFNYHKKDIWWCITGINIGTEINGKNNNFERPVLIIKGINKYQFFGVPLSTNRKKGEYYVKIKYLSVNTQITKISIACLNQLKVFSAKRLIRKMGVIHDNYSIKLNKIISGMFIKTKPRH